MYVKYMLKYFLLLITLPFVFSQSACDNCINSMKIGENIDCTNICNHQTTHLNDCLDYMDSENLYESGKREFEKFTWYLDKIRNEKFSEIFPELKNYYDC